MKNDWLPGFAKNTGFTTMGAAGGILFAFALEVGYPIRAEDQPEWCSNIGPLCWIYEWQTLTAGVFALLGAAATIVYIREGNRLHERIENARLGIQSNKEISFAASAIRDCNTVSNLLTSFADSIADPENFGWHFPSPDVEGIIEFTNFNFPSELDAVLSREIVIFCESIHSLNKNNVHFAQHGHEFSELTSIEEEAMKIIGRANIIRKRIFKEFISERIKLLEEMGQNRQQILSRHKIDVHGNPTSLEQ